ncbi:adhesin, partial [Corynebacterium marquesiae]
DEPSDEPSESKPSTPESEGEKPSESDEPSDEPSESKPSTPESEGEKPSESDEPSDEPSESEKPSESKPSTPESDGEKNPSDKPEKGTTPWWIYLIPGIGLGKIIKDHQDQNDHGNHDGGNGEHTDGHDNGNGHEAKDQGAPKGGNSDNGHGRGVEAQGQKPEKTGNALPSNADRVEIKSVPSGATELEPGMQDYIK